MRRARKSFAPSAVPESHKPYHAKKGNVVGMPRDNIEEAFADARALGTGSRVVDAKGTILARWVNAVGTKGWWKTQSE